MQSWPGTVCTKVERAHHRGERLRRELHTDKQWSGGCTFIPRSAWEAISRTADLNFVIAIGRNRIKV